MVHGTCEKLKFGFDLHLKRYFSSFTELCGAWLCLTERHRDPLPLPPPKMANFFFYMSFSRKRPGNYKVRYVKFWLQFVLQKLEIDIFDSFETTRFSATYRFWPFFSSFFIVTFDWKGNFKFLWFYREDLAQICPSQLYFNLKYIFLCIKINF